MGANLNQAGPDGFRALMFAAQNAHLRVVKLLVRRLGASVSEYLARHRSDLSGVTIAQGESPCQSGPSFQRKVCASGLGASSLLGSDI